MSESPVILSAISEPGIVLISKTNDECEVVLRLIRSLPGSLIERARVHIDGRPFPTRNANREEDVKMERPPDKRHALEMEFWPQDLLRRAGCARKINTATCVDALRPVGTRNFCVKRMIYSVASSSFACASVPASGALVEKTL